ncbi:hypothetical protein [Aquimonas voraii]|uniref:Lipocalin-like domain-containing protein n=1 Tax=Aquimonas voraii TaxID=265719 RepID=A0A1G6X4Z1_9GAMM|nr:hypothetical protein [Aquimonas voraii]SDD72395.1 hypothetical protein SAMN04488509_10611 [Aquimonas voraii]
MSDPTLLAALLSTALASGAAAPPRDAALAEALSGLWCFSRDEGRSCWAWEEVTADGGLRVWGQTPDGLNRFWSEGRYTVEGVVTCVEITASSEHAPHVAGDAFCAEVVHVDERVHRFRAVGGTRETVTYRLADTAEAPRFEDARASLAPALISP